MPDWQLAWWTEHPGDDTVRVVTFGEVMIRMAPEELLRVRQVLPGRFDATLGGGEVKVAGAVAQQGGQRGYPSIMPTHPVPN